MTVPFQNIPDNWRLPLFWAEIDPSKANSAQQTQRTLLIGQMTSAGDATSGIPILAVSQNSVNARTGADSIVARDYAKYRLNDPSGEVWILPVSDDGSAVAATGSLTFTHVPTGAGTLNFYIGGQRVQMLVVGTETLPNLATNLVAAINAIPTIPVTASTVSGGLVTLTAVNKGLLGNDIDLQVNYRGHQGGEVTPPGVTFTIVGMASGATNPTFTTAFANCGDQTFDFINFPYTDSTSLDAFQSFENFITGRWAWSRQVFGHGMTAKRGNVSPLASFGTGRNDPNISCIGFQGIPNTADEVSAAFLGAIAPSLRNDPGIPVQFIQVQGLLAPPIQNQFASTDRNVLLYDGISTFTVDASGAIITENIITMYQLDTSGQPDNSYLEIETMFQLAFLLRRLKSFVLSNYSRKKLAKDGTRLIPGSAVLTPGIVRQGIIAQYGTMVDLGEVQDIPDFKANLIVEINTNNPNRLDVLWPGDLIGQLRMFALLAQFRLQ